MLRSHSMDPLFDSAGTQIIDTNATLLGRYISNKFIHGIHILKFQVQVYSVL